MSSALNGTGITFSDGSTQGTSATTLNNVNIQSFTSTGTWSKPAGSNRSWAVIEVWGGGGGGSVGGSGGGGGAGAYTYFLIPLANLPATMTATVGGGGAAGYTAGSGGTSSVSWASGGTAYLGKTSISCTGGGGANYYSGNPGAGGTSSLGLYFGYVDAVYTTGGAVRGQAVSGNGAGGDSVSGGPSGGYLPSAISGVSAGTGGNYGYNGTAGRVVITCY